MSSENPASELTIQELRSRQSPNLQTYGQRDGEGLFADSFLMGRPQVGQLRNGAEISGTCGERVVELVRMLAVGDLDWNQPVE
jgi:hypothetical protein